MTKNRLTKETAEMLADRCGGMLASTTKLSEALGYDRKYVATKLKESKAKVYGEGKQIRYNVIEVAEIFHEGVV